jgi:hypothetical protein
MDALDKLSNDIARMLIWEFDIRNNIEGDEEFDFNFLVEKIKESIIEHLAKEK